MFRSALHGFAGNLGKGVNERLQGDPDVRFTAADILKERDLPAITPPGKVKNAGKLNTFAQFLPFGVDRVDADESPTADIDGIDDARVNADIAVIDTGVDSDNVGSERLPAVSTAPAAAACQASGPTTRISPVTALMSPARRRRSTTPTGTSGWRPARACGPCGCSTRRAWAVTRWILCGVDWVAAHADTIDVANMSLSDIGRSDGECGARFHDPTHVGICGLVAAGVTVAAAAGNESRDTADEVPAAYPEVITVSAMADGDGLPGGARPRPRLPARNVR